MMQTWLIQRLTKPLRINNPFEFGGGLQHGGLSDQGYSALKQIFDFDYMGSAEFEWGAVPKTINGIAKEHNNYVAFNFEVKTKKGNRAIVHVICHSRLTSEVERRIKIFAFEEPNKELRTKEWVHLRDNIDKIPYYEKNVGWLELDNGFFFFTDQEMFDKTKKLFEIKER